jgi:hypothetical protein
LVHREDERRLETQRRENHHRARRQEAAIWAAQAALDEDDVTGREV